MSKVTSLYNGWKMKRQFHRLVRTTEPRLLKDVGYPPELVEQRMRTPFWKFSA